MQVGAHLLGFKFGCGANDVTKPQDGIEAPIFTSQIEPVSDLLGKLTSYVVFILAEATIPGESPLWRFFGLWLFLLTWRTGCILGTFSGEHDPAAMFTRAWGRMPTGTPRSHATHGGGHNNSVHGL